LQAAINSGIAQELKTVSPARIGITHCSIETAVLLLRRFHPTLQGQYQHQFHKPFRPIQHNFPYKKSILRILHTNIVFHTPPWMADALEVSNPTDAEPAKISILYGSATTFYG